MIRIVQFDPTEPKSRRCCRRRSIRDRATETAAARIVARVRAEGDAAVRRFARSLDGWSGPIEVSRRQIDAGARQAPAAVRAALKQAARAIRVVAEAQRPREWRVTPTPGVTVSQRVIPLDRVGCYVPGGRYPLPSSLLMTAIPARVAGVPEVVVCSPSVDPVVLAAAVEAGVDRVFRLGGAHAVAAMAYGTATVPRVSKIVGPGNRWVSAAKALVAADCPIDFYAGPTEILIVAERGRASWIAADLIAQAEHDPDARAVFITSSRALATRVAEEVAASAAGHRTGGHVAVASRRASSSRDRWPRPRRWPTTPPPSTWWWTPRPGPGRFAMRARSSSARGRRRSPATMPSDRITRCPPPASPGCAAACTPPTS